MSSFRTAVGAAAIVLLSSAARADWPVYRADNNRTACTAESLAFPLSAAWEYRFAQRPRPAWPAPAEELPRAHGDNAFHVVVAGGRAFFGSSVYDCVYAVDAGTGRPAWTFFADGPVRFPPAWANGRLYFGSDDGYVYCLNAGDGSLVWKYRPGPTAQKALCSGRMVSAWPIRTGVLVDGGQVLATAGVFPYEGIYVCALDPATGRVLWQNDSASAPAHDLPFGGVAPHGQLVATRDLLFVPSGRATPVAYSRRDGRLAFVTPAQGKGGGTWIALDGERVLTGDEYSGDPMKLAYDARTGAVLGRPFAWVTGEVDLALGPEFAHVVTRRGLESVDRKAYAKIQDSIDAARKTLLHNRRRIETILRKRGAPATLPLPDVHLADLTPAKAITGFGTPTKDKALAGGPLTIAGKTYPRGMAVHAVSELVYAIRPEYRAFVATAGLDAGSQGRGSVAFEVYVDGRLEGGSPVLREQDGPWNLCLALPAGAKELRLVVTDGGDDFNYDLADWACAGFVTDAGKPVPAFRRDDGQARSLAQLDKENRGLSENLEELLRQKQVRILPRTGLCRVIACGRAVIAGGDGFVVALDAATDKELWQAKVEGRAVGLSAAGGRLFVSTDAGRVYCFGPPVEGRECSVVMIGGTRPVSLEECRRSEYAAEAEAIVAAVGKDKGYCLIDGLGGNARSAQLAVQLAIRTKWRILALQGDRARLMEARETLAAMGLLGDRVAVAPWTAAELPDYFANVIVSEEMSGQVPAEKIPADWKRLLSPGGGMAVFCAAGADGKVAASKVVRGPLEGAGRWAGEYGNEGNTGCSDDERVKGPFSVLWYGEPGGVGMVERHARVSAPLAADGRVFIPGQDAVMACDAYNGTLLWRRELPRSARVRVDADGGNMALDGESLYVVAKDTCYRLSAATGEIVRTFAVPVGEGGPRRWGYLGASGGMVFGTSSRALRGEVGAVWEKHVDPATGKWRPLTEAEMSDPKRTIGRTFVEAYPEPNEDARKALQRRGALWHNVDEYGHWVGVPDPTPPTKVLKAGQTLFAYDAQTGKLLWKHEGRQIAHIGIAAGGGRIYFADSCPDDRRAQALAAQADETAKGRYEPAVLPPEAKAGGPDYRLVTALEARTGSPVWSRAVDMTGCGGDMMGSAFKDGVLLFFGHFSNHDTGAFLQGRLTWRRITAMDGSTGELLWSRPLNYLRRPLIVGERIIIEPRAAQLRTGKVITREHPLSAQAVPWEFLRPGHSCGISSASAGTLFYRSACVALLDLAGDAGLSLFGGLRPGCWINTVSASGMVLIPEASSGCTCSYPIRSSVALVPRGTRGGDQSVFITHGPASPVRRMALLLGATGDVRDSKGGLWMAYPRPAAQSTIGYGPYGLPLDLRERVADGMGFSGRDPRRTAGPGPAGAPAWCLGMRRFELPLVDGAAGEGPVKFRVVFGFAAMPGDKPGQRVFDLKVGSQTVQGVDVAAADGAREKLFETVELFVTVGDVEAADSVLVELIPRKADPTPQEVPILTTVEVEAQGAAAAALPVPAGAAEARKALAAGDAPAAVRYLRTRWDAAHAPILSGYQRVAGDELRDLVRLRLEIAAKIRGAKPAHAARLLAQAEPALERIGDRDLADSVRRELGYVTEWKVAGPFLLPEGMPTAAEALASGRPEVAGAVKQWKTVRSRGLRLNLAEALGHQDCAGGYAMVRFSLPEAKELRLEVAADDSFAVWLNNRRVGATRDLLAPAGKAQTVWADGEKGENTLLFYVPNLIQHWTLQVKLTGRDGVPVIPEPASK